MNFLRDFVEKIFSQHLGTINPKFLIELRL